LEVKAKYNEIKVRPELFCLNLFPLLKQKRPNV